MKQFLLKTLAFLLLVYLLASGLQLLVDRGLRKDDVDYKEWNDILYSRINADILIQGSSRAYRHISPAVIDSAFNMNSYNLGLSGIDFSMQYYRFQYYLKYNKPPKYIIQNIDPAALNKQHDLVDYWQFLPFLNDKAIVKMVRAYKGLDWRDFYVPLYKYHGLYRTVWKGLLYNVRPPHGNNGKYKGFAALDSTWNNAFAEFKSKHPNGYRIKPDTTTLNLMNDFLSYCNSKGIKVIFVCAPTYYEARKLLLNNDSIMGIFKNFANKYNVPMLDYSRDSLCFNTKYFYNANHMNKPGVAKFNAELAKDLKGLIK